MSGWRSATIWAISQSALLKYWKAWPGRGLLSLSFCIPSVPLMPMVGELESGKVGLSVVICPATTATSLSA